jgi:hypothetical protein
LIGVVGSRAGRNVFEAKRWPGGLSHKSVRAIQVPKLPNDRHASRVQQVRKRVIKKLRMQLEDRIRRATTFLVWWG